MTKNPNLHFDEDQLDRIEKGCLTKTGEYATVNRDVFQQLVDQAREATRVPHLEHQHECQVKDKIRILNQFQSKIKEFEELIAAFKTHPSVSL